MIERNTTIPIKKTQIFTTAEDFQTSVPIHVTQGERTLAKDNIDLGRFTLTDLPPARRGTPQIEVTFDIDANGILHVTAKDKGTGKSQSMDIVAPHKMDKKDIEAKMEDAKKYEEADKKIREQVEARNDAESLIYTAEHTLDEYKDKVTKEDKERVEKAKDALAAAAKTDDIEGIRSKMEELKQVLGEVGGKFYKGQPGAGAEQGAPGPGSSPDSDEGAPGPEDSSATDADFKVEK
jgi:molecular chaperone DnaK